jgi:RNA polymerase sigma-70 factor, ECF subfamily
MDYSQPDATLSGRGCYCPYVIQPRKKVALRRRLWSMRMFDRASDLSVTPTRVIAWRIDRLRDAGFSDRFATALAGDTRYDVHALLDLIDRGCSAELAARIVAPLGQARAMPTASHGRLTHRTADACVTRVGRPAGGACRTSVTAARAEHESRMWIERLTATGAERDAALVELHVLLSRAARFEVSRRRATSEQLRCKDDDDLAHRSADHARVAIVGELGAFRGESSFRTWAYKFALYAAAANVRKRAWRGREIRLTAESWRVTLEDRERTAEQLVEAADTLAVLSEAIERELSPHEREVLVATAINDVPIDVLAEWLNTTRGPLYKTVQIGRGKLSAALGARGLGSRPTTAAGAGVTGPACSVRDHLIALLTGSSSPELGCEECFEQLDRYVELELDGSDADTAVPRMRAHLEGCSACGEDHQSLRALLLSEA